MKVNTPYMDGMGDASTQMGKLLIEINQSQNSICMYFFSFWHAFFHADTHPTAGITVKTIY